ncbi:hypothetical protein KRP22_010326 [Phytophthora ramorum]|nr:hypothetical protein KRP22_5805 [Phytophthora ramorum]
MSPMQLLAVWLTRHYATYASSTTKVEMLQELCQGMRDSGYPGCTVNAIRSKIDGLRREAQRERQENSRSIGDRRHSRAFQQYQQSLMDIFTSEGVNGREYDDTSDTETSDEDESPANRGGRIEPNEQPDVKSELVMENGSRNAPFTLNEEGEREGRAPRTHFRDELQGDRSLNVSEIQRRFKLLCARHDLEQRGVEMNVIDRLLPLPEE